MSVAPDWLKVWSSRGGTSSFTVAWKLIPESSEFMEGRMSFGPDGPYDFSDVARVIDLLDTCERHGRSLRDRMGTLQDVRGWGQIGPHWSVIEEAFKADTAARVKIRRASLYRKDGYTPRKRPLKVQHESPCRTYLLLSALRVSRLHSILTPDGDRHILKLVDQARAFYDPEEWLSKVGLSTSPTTSLGDSNANDLA